NGNNGYVDDLIGWDFFNNDNDPMDVITRGTQAAGTLGALANNDEGVVGINWKVQIMPVKITERADVAELAVLPFAAPNGTAYSATNGARVSYNGYKAPRDIIPQPVFDAVYAAIQEAGARGQLFVAAAGHDGTDNDIRPYDPASGEMENIISVTATDKHDR